MTKRRIAQTVCALGAVLAAIFGISTIACNLQQGGGGSPGEQPGPNPLCAILNVPVNIQVSSESALPLTIIYQTDANATTVRGFYVEVSGADPDATEVSGDFVLPDELLPGANQVYNLDLSLLTAAFYKVGIRSTVGGNERRCVSEGTLLVTQDALPEFTLPNNDTVADLGEDVLVGFDVHDPAGAVHWRLFYISEDEALDVPADELGTQIRTGWGNSDLVAWDTSPVIEGTYRLGLTTTDSGMTVAETINAGNAAAVRTIFNQFTVTVQEPAPPVSEDSPLIDVTEPNATVMAPSGEDFTVDVKFTATVRDEAAVNPSVTVFLDLDKKANSGNELIQETGLSPSATQVTINTKTLGVDTYYVGAIIDDGVNPPVTDYAKGRIEVSLDVDTLKVLKPDLNLTVPPGEVIDVKWQTNVPAAEANVDVFRRQVTVAANGTITPTGAEIEILASTNGVTETQFVSYESGRFQVSVRLKFKDPAKDDMIAVAPSLVDVTTLPRILWVGDLANYSPTVQSQSDGAILEGHNFEDNAGSKATGGEDFNGDGIDDFVLVAQYGKPEFINPTGIGDGEAYLFFGQSSRYSGSHNLNSVSSTKIPGAVLTGIPPVIDLANGKTTWGMTDAFIAKDADGDGVGELLFGFPYVTQNRKRATRLEVTTQFENGAVVVVSSKNSVVRGAGVYATNGSRVELEKVGMKFDQERVGPEPELASGSTSRCSADWGWMADYFTPYDGDCPEVEECESVECPQNGDQYGPCPDNGAGTPTCVEGQLCPTLCSDGVTVCVAEDETQQCPYVMPVPSYLGDSGCLLNRWGDPRVAPDGLNDTLVEPKHGFLSYMGANYIAHHVEVHNEFPCASRVYPCPACWDETALGLTNPVNPVPCLCEQYVLDPTTFSWTVHIDDTTDPFCNSYADGWDSGDPLALLPEDVAGSCDSQNYSIQDTLADRRPLVDVGYSSGLSPNPYLSSGFYPDRIAGEENDEDVLWNTAREPWGMRLVGREAGPSFEELGGFGVSITQSGTELIVTAPLRDAVLWTPLSPDGELFEVPSGENEDSGLAYMYSNYAYWEGSPPDLMTLADYEVGIGGETTFPPKPHMYRAGGGGHDGVHGDMPSPPGCSRYRSEIFFHRQSPSVFDVTGGLHFAGQASERIENILGIPDFNNDTRVDVVISTPSANTGDGAAYIVFRRANTLEADYLLEKLALDPHDVGRLAGIYLTGNAGEGAQFGSALAGGNERTDELFNFDGMNAKGEVFEDVAIGSPNANSGTGEVLVVFGTNELTSPAAGLPVDSVLAQKRGVLIVGSRPGDGFGFNVANAGDFDGDGLEELLISAPFATPRFDSDPTDSTDVLDTKGVDRNLDGKRDDVTGPKGIPDGLVNDWDKLEGAGLVYVIFSSDYGDFWPGMTISIDNLGTAALPGFIIAGRRGADLNPADPTHPHMGDRLGGGDADHLTEGNPNKTFSRSRGLAGIGDVDGDGKSDILIGAILADPRVDSQTGIGTVNGGEAYLIYGFSQNK